MSDDEEEKNESRFVHFIEVLMFRHSRLKSSSSSQADRVSFCAELCADTKSLLASEVQWRHSVLRAHLNIIHSGLKRSFRNYEIAFSAQLNFDGAFPSRLRTIARYFVNFYYILIQLLIMIAQKANEKRSRAIPITTTIAPAEMLFFLFFERPVGTDLHHATSEHNMFDEAMERMWSIVWHTFSSSRDVTMRRKRKCHESFCWLLICRWRHYLDNYFPISVTAITRRCWKYGVRRTST